MPPIKIPAKTEYKTFQFKVESVDEDQGRVSGYLSTFNNVDAGNGYIRDRVKKGAFKKTLVEAKSRAENNGHRFLFPHLWMHDPMTPTGGYVEAIEDNKGLYVTYELDISCNTAGIPNNPKAMMEFSGSKRGYISEQSIGYEVILSDVVEDVVDGKKIHVRDLIELRLVEGSGVTANFAMNDQAQITDVKTVTDADALEIKATICGSTSGEIGPRDEAWDGGKAKGQIFAAAENSDGSLKVSACKKYFMAMDGDGSNKGDWSYPFWYVGDSPHICVSAVKAVAGAIGGARGADAPGGLKAKVETLYGRINKKYPDDPELTPPWKSSDSGKIRSFKSFMDHYREEMCEDLLEDWQEVYLQALTCAIVEALKSGDPGEFSQVLDDFKTTVMNKFVTQAQELGLADFLSSGTYSFSPADRLMYSYGYMSRHKKPEVKAGARFSASSKAMLQDHVDTLYGQADEMMSTMGTHAKALVGAADALAQQLGGNQEEDETAPPDDTSQGKANLFLGVLPERRRPSPTRTPSRESETTQQTSIQPDGETTITDRTTEADLEAAYQALAVFNTRH